MPESALKAQIFGTQLFHSMSGSGMRATAHRLDSFLGGFADWAEWKAMTVGTLQMSEHYHVATGGSTDESRTQHPTLWHTLICLAVERIYSQLVARCTG
jgi:hypothetical protein